MRANAAKQGHRLRFQTAQGERSKLYNTRFRVGSGGLRVEDLETLPIRYQEYHFHRSQELTAYIRSEGSEHETTKMDRIAERLRVRNSVTSQKLQ